MAANVKVLPKAPPPVEEDDDPPDCPACPPVGAPAWMATFADMATLLMAFFVLILAFANFDEVSFKKMAGSMREAFGTQIIVPLENPPSTTFIELDYRPQQSSENVEETEPSSGEPNEGKDKAETPNPVESAAKALASAIRQALATGELTVESDEGSVTVKLPPGAGREEAEALAEAIAQTAGTEALRADDGENPQPSDSTGGVGGEKLGGGAEGESENFRAGIAEARLQVALRQEIAQGLVAVERREDKVFVTVGAGGAFPSGSADLTGSAIDIMEKLGAAAAGKNAQVTVTGHTDNVPISDGRFRDNWDLAAARASSVVRALGETGTIDPARMTAVSRGESDPLADNESEEGREKNRRIEIEMTFDPVTGGTTP